MGELVGVSVGVGEGVMLAGEVGVLGWGVGGWKGVLLGVGVVLMVGVCVMVVVPVPVVVAVAVGVRLGAMEPVASGVNVMVRVRVANTTGVQEAVNAGVPEVCPPLPGASRAATAPKK